MISRRWRRLAARELVRTLGQRIEQFEVDGLVYVREAGTDRWYTVVAWDGRPRVQQLASCETCDSEVPDRFSVEEDERGVLVPVRSRCDHCVFAAVVAADPETPEAAPAAGAPHGLLLDLRSPPPTRGSTSGTNGRSVPPHRGSASKA